MLPEDTSFRYTGLPMKGSLVAAKLIPHHLLVPAMNKILNRRSRDSE